MKFLVIRFSSIGDIVLASPVFRCLKKQTHVINKLNWQKFILTNLHIDFMPKRHITTRSLDTLISFGVKDDGRGLDYFIPEKDFIRDEDLPTSHHAGFIAIVIGASY